MTPITSDTALLVTRSPNLAIGLRALLLSVPQIRFVERVSGVADLLSHVAERRPVLIILDSEMLGSHLPELLPALRHLSPKTHRLILSDRVAEMRELAAGGFETVVIKGEHPGGLATTIERLLDI